MEEKGDEAFFHAAIGEGSTGLVGKKGATFSSTCCLMAAMKRDALPPSPDSDPQNPVEWGVDQKKNDPLWNLLGQASHREADAFFARDIVRCTRQVEDSASLGSRIVSFFTPPRLALSAAALACAMVAYQMWPTLPGQPGQDQVTHNTPEPEPSLALTELVIEESLAAVAEDPTIFTHDEVVAMVGF